MDIALCLLLYKVLYEYLGTLLHVYCCTSIDRHCIMSVAVRVVIGIAEYLWILLNVYLCLNIELSFLYKYSCMCVAYVSVYTYTHNVCCSTNSDGRCLIIMNNDECSPCMNVEFSFLYKYSCICVTYVSVYTYSRAVLFVCMCSYKRTVKHFRSL